MQIKYYAHAYTDSHEKVLKAKTPHKLTKICNCRIFLDQTMHKFVILNPSLVLENGTVN